VVGNVCQIAIGVCFMMNGYNHSMGAISTYLIKVFGGEWTQKDPMHVVSKGDTIIGYDVWIGNSAILTPGIKVGDGAIIGKNTLIKKDVVPYRRLLSELEVESQIFYF
jgi:virginiamycin A acetyltransferase